MFQTGLRCFGPIARERWGRKILVDEFSVPDSKLKLSKIPSDFINFSEVRRLPDRQLAYTAHLASRLGMSNEDFWKEIRDAFLDSFHRMKPKLFTQCFVSITNRENLLTQHDLKSIIASFTNRVCEFRLIDVIQIMHAVKNILPINTSVWNRIVVLLYAEPQLSCKHLAVLFACAGKLGGNELLLPLIQKSTSEIERFNEYEIAALVRSCASLFDDSNSAEIVSFIETIIIRNSSVTRMDLGCLNILATSLSRIEHGMNQRVFSTESRNTLFRVLQQSMLMGNSHVTLIPHLLYGCCQLATDVSHKGFCVNQGRFVLRHLKHFKAASLPVAMEGLNLLRSKFPNDQDIAIVADEITEVTERIVEQFLLVASDDEKRKLVDSNVCQISSWFSEKLNRSIDFEPEIEEKNSESLSVLDSACSMWLKVSKANQPVDISSDLSEIHSETADKDTVSDPVYSLVFRSMLRSGNRTRFDYFQERFKLEHESCEVKTLLRALQLDGSTEWLIESVLARFHEVENRDILGTLQLLARCQVRLAAHPEADKIESKLAVELNEVKSESRRQMMIQTAKSLGLNHPLDIIDDFEAALATDRKTKLA
jgi:hypothetical protein